MTRDESARIAKLAWAAFPHCTLDEFAIEAFHVALHDLDFNDAFEATRNALREPGQTFPPAPGQIRGGVRSLKNARNALVKIDMGPEISSDDAKAICDRAWSALDERQKKVLGL